MVDPDIKAACESAGVGRTTAHRWLKEPAFRDELARQRDAVLKTQHTRLKKLEQQTPPIERQFIGWPQNPWTEEQKAEAIRQNPTGRIFWGSLLDGLKTDQKPE